VRGRNGSGGPAAGLPANNEGPDAAFVRDANGLVPVVAGTEVEERQAGRGQSGREWSYAGD